MKKDNIKPSVVAYYQTRASILHPILAITQVNIGIYLLFAAPYINTRFQTVAAPMFFRQLSCFIFLFLFSLFTGKILKIMSLRDFGYCVIIGETFLIFYHYSNRFYWNQPLTVFSASELQDPSRPDRRA
jgi:hypothetical protein